MAEERREEDMQYAQVVAARFLERPNRFIARCLLDGEEVQAHVKNTGRCRELLLPGVTVYLERAQNPQRKTPYSLIAVDKNGLLINMDSQAPNALAAEAIASGRVVLPGFCPQTLTLRREVTHGDSRFDLYLEDGERRAFVEVKGVTLEEDGIALFPDAPTLRGMKHLEGLIRAVAEGYEAALLLVIQFAGAREFRPNDRTHPQFGEALRRAEGAGVRLLAYECAVAPGEAVITHPVPIRL